MVTGVEAAGLVLAAFPLVISGLSHYVKGVETIRRWRRFYRELASYTRTLEIQKVLCLNTLEELLDGIIQSDEELAAMLAEPGGASWRKPDHEERLRTRLSESYKPFLDTLADMIETLEVMKKKLGIGPSGTNPWDNFSFLERELERLKLVMSKEVYGELRDKVDKANKHIQDLTRQNLNLELMRRRRRSRHPSADFKLIRRHASSLYNVIVGGTCWKCRCKEYHTVSLRLEPRPSIFNELTTTESMDSRFRVLLSTQVPNGKKRASGFKWRELDVETMEMVSNQIQPPNDNKSQGMSSGAARGWQSSAGASSRNEHASVTNAQIELGRFPTESSSISALNPTNDICNLVSASPSSERAIGYLVDDTHAYYQHLIYFVDTRSNPDIQTKSLDNLLSDPQQRSARFPLTRGHRLKMAVTLASSVLQLDRTSWLKGQWRSSDIFFHYDNEHTPVASTLSTVEPCVAWKLSLAGAELHRPSESNSLKGYLVHSKVFFALGLTLIELCFGKTLLEMQIPEDVTEDVASDDSITRLNIAHRILGAVYENGGYRYGEVVRRCIFCSFDMRDVSLDNDDFQEAAFDRILTPLIDDLEAFHGTRS